ncbi:MAG: hypothetical protein WDN00_08210 [Limisphaerales bacterium]
MRADEVLPVLTAKGVVYSNITVTTVTATDIYFTYAKGMGNAKLKDLTPELQKHLITTPPKVPPRKNNRLRTPPSIINTL